MCKGVVGPGLLFIEKTRKSALLQMHLQRQHFLLSFLITLLVGPAGVEFGFELAASRSADRRLSN